MTLEIRVVRRSIWGVIITAFLAIFVAYLISHASGCQPAKAPEDRVAQLEQTYVVVVGGLVDAYEAGLIKDEVWRNTIKPSRLSAKAAIERYRELSAQSPGIESQKAMESANQALQTLQALLPKKTSNPNGIVITPSSRFPTMR